MNAKRPPKFPITSIQAYNPATRILKKDRQALLIHYVLEGSYSNQ